MNSLAQTAFDPDGVDVNVGAAYSKSESVGTWWPSVSSYAALISVGAVVGSLTSAVAGPVVCAMTPKLVRQHEAARSTETTSTVQQVDVLKNAQYAHLFQIISQAAKFMPGEQFYLNRKASDEGYLALSQLSLANIPPPKAFVQDEDTVVFSWEQGTSKLYMTVSEGHAYLLLSDSVGSDVISDSSLASILGSGLLEDVGAYVGRADSAA